MKRLFSKILLCLAVVFFSGPAGAQTNKAPSNELLQYVIDERGDTIYVDELKPARIHPKKYLNKREWVKYYRRVHNFSKAYPYALFVAQTIRETDSLFSIYNLKPTEQERYLNGLKDELLNNFKPIFEGLTLSQGLMMIRLIDREVGMPPYDIIKKYLGKVNAQFWQGVAKLLKGNIKQRYDPTGEDADLEQLVHAWYYGEFDELYEFIFGKPRPQIIIPEKFRESYYKSLEEAKVRKQARDKERDKEKSKAKEKKRK